MSKPLKGKHQPSTIVRLVNINKVQQLYTSSIICVYMFKPFSKFNDNQCKFEKIQKIFKVQLQSNKVEKISKNFKVQFKSTGFEKISKNFQSPTSIKQG